MLKQHVIRPEKTNQSGLESATMVKQTYLKFISGYPHLPTFQLFQSR